MVATPRLGLNKQPVGDNVNTWGGILNDQVVELLDEAVAGVETIMLAGSRALTSTNFVSNEARNAVLIITDGGLAGPATITIPAKEKQYVIVNQTPYALMFSCGGAAATVPSGRRGPLICDGSAVSFIDAVGDAAAATAASASQAAASATSAASAASTATTRRDQALAARDEAYAARDITIAARDVTTTARDVTLGYRNAASASAASAAASAASAAAPSATRVYDNLLHFGS